MLRFLWSSFLAGSCLTMAAQAEEPRLRDLIDREIQAGWQREKITPALPADDATFLRRIFLDLVGAIPTHDETVQFLQDTDQEKRAKLIDHLLDDPRYAGHQANVWDQVLFGRNPPNPEATRNRAGFQKWLKEKFAKNEGFDQWVRELLLAEGNSQDHGPPLFYVQFRGNAEETAVAVTRLFLGTQLQCAQCHDHPQEAWTQKDFFGMAAFFARLVVVDGGGEAAKKRFMINEKRTGEVLFTGPAAEQKPGQKGTPVGARFLNGPDLVEPPLPKDYKEPAKGTKNLPKPDFSRKDQLAAWVTSPANPYFARAAANRLWGQFFRRGLAHPVDNLSQKNTASHPDLLNILEKELAVHRFDLKWFFRELTNSKAYQLASTGSTAEPRWFEQMRLRPLSAEEMLTALLAVTGGKDGEKLTPGFQENWLRSFGSPTDGRGDFQASLNERLFVNNNANLRQMLQRRKGNFVDALLNDKGPWEKKVDRLFLTVLNRPPRKQEKELFVAHLTSAGPAEGLLEEAVWALVASVEFRFCP